MREVLSVPEVDELCKKRYAELACVLLTRIGSCADLKPADGLSPVQHAIDAFKEFIDRTKSTFIFEALEANKSWTSFETSLTNTEVGRERGMGCYRFLILTSLISSHRALPWWRRCCARMRRSRSHPWWSCLSPC